MVVGKMVISEIQSIISISKNNVAYTCNNDIYTLLVNIVA